MGSYRDQYERYYKSIGKNNSRYVPISGERDNLNSYYTRGKRRKKGGMITILLTQSIGIFIIVLIIMALKYAPYKEFNVIYSNIKETMSSKDYFDKINDFDAIEVLNKFKDKISKNYGIENKIDGELMTPLIGEIETIEDGISIKSLDEKEVFSSFDGEVTKISTNDNKTNLVIDHGNGIESYYNLISKVNVKKGDKVEKGECIGFNTKVSEENYKIEFKISYMGRFIEPAKYINFKG